MESIQDILVHYRQEAEDAKQAASKLQRQIYNISTLRLLLFVACVAGIIFCWGEGWWGIVGVLLITLLPFGLLIQRHNRRFYQKAYQEKRQEVNRQEIAALKDYDFSAFADGSEYLDAGHLYAFDLDVFGPHSLFQSMNRTCTPLGKSQLAAWLGQHLEQKEEILRRQEAVSELAPLWEFRQRFRILGLLHKGKAADERELNEWVASPGVFRTKRVLRLLPSLVMTINAVCILLTVFGIMPASIYGIIWTFIVLSAFAFTNKVTKIQAIYGKKLQILSTYAALIRHIEAQPMQAALLKDIQQLMEGEKKHASHAIYELSRLMHTLDQRNNMLMYTVLNGFFFWELRQMIRIEHWKEQYSADLPRWLTAIGQMDALCSMATFAYNHPDYTYPKIEKETADSGAFVLRGKELGHPLMQREQCVRNDIDIKKRPFFIIITGANMAGKSTYLRTVGINYLLACIGAPVCARQMELTPARLVTSLRTSDSLNDNESYFFAELKRLKLIIDKLQAGEKLFIILDEILKGTNSIDKQKGSLALIQQFITLQANGIIATHDLLLGTLIDHFPEDICNNCFEADITDNELTFSYKMRAGIAKNMNACFLMKKMGITIE